MLAATKKEASVAKPRHARGEEAAPKVGNLCLSLRWGVGLCLVGNKGIEYIGIV